MNIFALDDDPVIAATMQCNKHVVKMSLESAQLLCNVLLAHGSQKSTLPYKPTHVHHPCSLWANKCPENAQWLLEHGLALCDEYTKRYGKRHKTHNVLLQIAQKLPQANAKNHTSFARAIKEPWKTQTANLPIIDAYRVFYVGDKARFAKWKPRAVAPSWWPFQE